jgi:hypothetical protein
VNTSVWHDVDSMIADASMLYKICEMQESAPSGVAGKAGKQVVEKVGERWFWAIEKQ